MDQHRMEKEQQSDSNCWIATTHGGSCTEFLLPVSQSDWDIWLESAWATSHHQPYDQETTAENTHGWCFNQSQQLFLLYCDLIKDVLFYRRLFKISRVMQQLLALYIREGRSFIYLQYLLIAFIYQVLLAEKRWVKEHLPSRW